MSIILTQRLFNIQNKLVNCDLISKNILTYSVDYCNLILSLSINVTPKILLTLYREIKDLINFDTDEIEINYVDNIFHFKITLVES